MTVSSFTRKHLLFAYVSHCQVNNEISHCSGDKKKRRGLTFIQPHRVKREKDVKSFIYVTHCKVQKTGYVTNDFLRGYFFFSLSLPSSFIFFSPFTSVYQFNFNLTNLLLLVHFFLLLF